MHAHPTFSLFLSDEPTFTLSLTHDLKQMMRKSDLCDLLIIEAVPLTICERPAKIGERKVINTAQVQLIELKPQA